MRSFQHSFCVFSHFITMFLFEIHLFLMMFNAKSDEKGTDSYDGSTLTKKFLTGQVYFVSRDSTHCHNVQNFKFTY